MQEYKLLDAIESEDIAKIRQYAEAKNERTVLMRRVNYLDSLLEECRDLRGLVWTTAEGESKAISDLEDSHLKNIIPHLVKQGGYNNRIRQEYQKRFGEAPALPSPDEDENFWY